MNHNIQTIKEKKDYNSMLYEILDLEAEILKEIKKLENMISPPFVAITKLKEILGE